MVPFLGLGGKENSGGKLRVLKGLFCLALHSLFRNQCCLIFPLVSLASGLNENHKDVNGMNKRKTRSFSSLDSFAHIAEGPVDLLVI